MAREYSLFDLLKGLEIKENPQAVVQFVLLLIFIGILVAVSIYILKRPEIKRKKWDEEVYNFILDFKNLTKDEIEKIESMMKKYDIKTKYNLIIKVGVFQKYMDREIIKIEQSHMSSQKKETLINKYIAIKNKIFGIENLRGENFNEFREY